MRRDGLFWVCFNIDLLLNILGSSGFCLLGDRINLSLNFWLIHLFSKCFSYLIKHFHQIKYCYILALVSVIDSKIITKNLPKFWGIATIIKIKFTEFQFFWNITLAGIKNWSFNAKNHILFRWKICIAMRHRLKLKKRLETWGIFFFIYFETYEQRKNSKIPKIRTVLIFVTFYLFKK